MKIWTYEDEEFILNHYVTQSVKWIAAQINRSESSVYKKAHLLKAGKKRASYNARKWEDSEIQFLRENYTKLTQPELAVKLNRNKNSVALKLSKLNLSWLDQFQKIEIGRKYGKITVLEANGLKRKESTYRGLCDCGNECTVGRGALLHGRHRSCGCEAAFGRRKAPGLASWRSLYVTCRGGAKARNLPFELSFENFILIARNSCHWCGKDPRSYNTYVCEDGSQNKRRNTIGKESVDQAWIKASGIDRIDSSIGYIPENCVPCCRNCNIMKFDLNVDEFLNHCRDILDFQSRNQLEINE